MSISLAHSALTQLCRPSRTYSLYIMYTPYYRTPRLFMSGYSANSDPLPPHLMMEDIVGDYKDKTVTLEDFPFFDLGIKMASVHPCKHASVMKVLLDRADAALKLRLARRKLASKRAIRAGEAERSPDEALQSSIVKNEPTARANASTGGDEWEVLEEGREPEEEPAIRVDQYLVVFLKFAATLIPTIEHDFTTAI